MSRRAGHELRRLIEQRTDELAGQPYEALAPADIDLVLTIAARVADPIAVSGAIPYPNPIGLPLTTASTMRPEYER